MPKSVFEIDHFFQSHQIDCQSRQEQDLTDPLCIIKEEVMDQVEEDENIVDDVGNDEDNFDDVSNGLHYDPHGDMNDENLKIYIDEALQVKYGCAGIHI